MERGGWAGEMLRDQVTLEEGGGCTQFVHGRFRMTIDLHIPTMPGRRTSGFDQQRKLRGRGGGLLLFHCRVKDQQASKSIPI